MIVVAASKWADIVRANPYESFCAKDPRMVHAAICDGLPCAQALKALLQKTSGTEAFAVEGNVIHLHIPDGYGTSQFAANHSALMA